jgi:predicted nucleic-acid-binding protein
MARALDTNVVVRFLTNDHPEQSAVAQELFRNDFVISSSVLMESEWVLRSVFRWNRGRIAAAFRDILDLPACLSAPPEINWVLERFAAGADFADMIHLCAAEGASAFATFDSDIARIVGAAAPLPIETLVW